MRRSDLIHEVATLILQRRQRPHRLRVAIDGRDAVGKTSFADELAGDLRREVAVIRAGIDGWHHPRAERHRLGRDSPLGYYRDSFDLEALRERLLLPLGPRGDGRYVTAAFDHLTDSPVAQAPRLAPPDAVLLFDGVFLLRPELCDAWDMTIYLSASPEVALERGVRREAPSEAEQPGIRTRYLSRYLPAHERYEVEVSPLASADIIVDNDDLAAPVLVHPPERGR